MRWEKYPGIAAEEVMYEMNINTRDFLLVIASVTLQLGIQQNLS